MLQQAIAEQYGLVLFTEKVTVGLVEHTLLILQRGLVCVRSRLSSVTLFHINSIGTQFTQHFPFFPLFGNLENSRGQIYQTIVFD